MNDDDTIYNRLRNDCKEEIKNGVTALVESARLFLIPSIRDKLETAYESYLFHYELGNLDHCDNELALISKLVDESI